ncbi:MAG: acetylglutamate kinase [Eggerthellaceae bacterium]|nr:acetylglutamate kinase [Eggerthellaceae bacterium]
MRENVSGNASEAARFTNAQRAEVLTQALPNLQQYNGKVVVIKYGGNAMIDDEVKQQVMSDIVLMSLVGVRVVLVHGGGPEISDMMKRLGKETLFVDGLRVTDQETVEIAQMVLAGKINKTLVSLLQTHGGQAMGISGLDGRMILAEVRDERLGLVGEIVGVNIQPVLDLLDTGYIPVISTVAGDVDGNTLNINGDTAAAAIAGALGAERLIMMTDIDGVLLDKNDPDTLIPEMSLDEARELVKSDVVSGGMVPKLECCISAISQGVKSVTIIDGRVPHALLMELFTDEGAGTMIRGL